LYDKNEDCTILENELFRLLTNLGEFWIAFCSCVWVRGGWTCLEMLIANNHLTYDYRCGL
jgi:hypothetical protein